MFCFFLNVYKVQLVSVTLNPLIHKGSLVLVCCCCCALPSLLAKQQQKQIARNFRNTNHLLWLTCVFVFNNIRRRKKKNFPS